MPRPRKKSDIVIPESLAPDITTLKPKTWRDYPRTKDHLAIVGFAPTTRHLAPYDNDEYEIWGLNEEYHFDWMKRYDRWFQIHPRWDFTRGNNLNDRNHFHWLQNKKGKCARCDGKGSWEVEEGKEKKVVTCPDCKGGNYVPPKEREGLIIYMQEHYDDIPGSVAYPLKEVIELLPASLHQRDYLTSSAALMLALAFLMGYKRVEFYGFEMGTMTEYHYQRANFEFLVGYFSAKGMEIIVPKQSTLLRGELYGFKNMKTGFRQNLEMRKAVLENQEKKQAEQVHIHTGKIQALQSVVSANHEFKKALEDTMRKYQEEIGRHNVIKGALVETENLTKLYDHYFLSGSEEGSMLSGEEIQGFTNLQYK